MKKLVAILAIALVVALCGWNLATAQDSSGTPDTGTTNGLPCIVMQASPVGSPNAAPTETALTVASPAAIALPPCATEAATPDGM